MGIAVRSQEAFFSGKERTLSVTFNAATLHDKTNGFQRCCSECAGLVEAPGGLVVLVGGKLETPAIEEKVEKERFFPLKNGDWPEIPHPGIVGADFVDSDPVHPCPGVAELVLHFSLVRSNDHHPFEQADMFSNLNENRFHLVQDGVPVAIFVGPGEQYAVLFFPFGR